MKRSVNEHVTLVEILELIRPWDEFVTACQAAVRRLEAEGIQSLVLVQFYSHPGSTEVGAVLIFADPTEMRRHIEMITGWEEFHQLIATVKPVEVRVHGKLSAEVEAWLRRMNAVERVFTHHIAGFVRPSDVPNDDFLTETLLRKPIGPRVSG
jgi:hypothetical protein